MTVSKHAAHQVFRGCALRNESIALALVCLYGCSSQESGTLSLVTGEETDTFTAAPTPVRLQIDSLSSSGQLTTLATAPLPATTVDLGSLDPSTQTTIVVSGFDATGSRVLTGRSLSFQVGVADGATLPIFVQRSGQMARLPDFQGDSRSSPIVTVLGGRYLLVTGGADATLAAQSRIFDFAGLSPLPSPPVLPVAPVSVASLGSVAWLFDASGSAVTYDFSASTSATASVPAGGPGSFADVAGGATVVADDGSEYIVGATRMTGAPSSAILKLDATTATASWLTLNAPRLGASAAWVHGRGLVVAGGSASAPGIDVVGAGALLQFAADPSTGGGAASLDNDHLVILAGGSLADGSDPGVRVVDLSCTASCTSTPWAPLPTTLASAQVFDVDASHALVVGTDPVSKTTRIFSATSSQGTEMATKVAHTGARAVASPVGAQGSIVLFGGAPELESFEP